MVFTSGATLKIELSMPADAPAGTVIHYTTDGKEPTASSTKYTASLTFNRSVTLRAKPFCDGKFYQGRWVSLSAEGGALPVKGWKIVKKNSDGTTTEEEISEPQYGFAMPSCQSLAINALFDTSGINTPVDDSWKKANGGWFTLDGRRLNGYPQKRGIYIHNGRKMVIE